MCVVNSTKAQARKDQERRSRPIKGWRVVLHLRRVRHERIKFFPGLDGGGDEAGSRDKPIIFGAHYIFNFARRSLGGIAGIWAGLFLATEIVVAT